MIERLRGKRCSELEMLATHECSGDLNISKEVMAHHVLAVVVAGLSPVVTVM